MTNKEQIKEELLKYSKIIKEKSIIFGLLIYKKTPIYASKAYKWYMSLDKKKKIIVGGSGSFLILLTLFNSCQREPKYISKGSSVIINEPLESSGSGSSDSPQDDKWAAFEAAKEQFRKEEEAEQRKKNRAGKSQYNKGCVIACLKESEVNSRNFDTPYMKWKGDKKCADENKLLDGKTCNTGKNKVANKPTWADVLLSAKFGGARGPDDYDLGSDFYRERLLETCSNPDPNYQKTCKTKTNRYKLKVVKNYLNRIGPLKDSSKLRRRLTESEYLARKDALTVWPCKEMGFFPAEEQLEMYNNPIAFHNKLVDDMNMPQEKCGIGFNGNCGSFQAGYRPYGKFAEADPYKELEDKTKWLYTPREFINEGPELKNLENDLD